MTRFAGLYLQPADKVALSGNTTEVNMGITDGMYQLGHAAQRLNHGSDELNRTLAAIDEVLGRLGIGMDYTLARPLHEDVHIGPDQKRVIEMGFLAYGRHKGRFRLLYKQLKVLEDRKAMANEGPGQLLPLLDAPRRVRHLAIDQLPELVAGLATAVDDVLRQLDRRKQLASQVLEQLQQMLIEEEASRPRLAPPDLASRTVAGPSTAAGPSRPDGPQPPARRRTNPGYRRQS